MVLEFALSFQPACPGRVAGAQVVATLTPKTVATSVVTVATMHTTATASTRGEVADEAGTPKAPHIPLLPNQSQLPSLKSVYFI